MGAICFVCVCVCVCVLQISCQKFNISLSAPVADVVPRADHCDGRQIAHMLTTQHVLKKTFFSFFEMPRCLFSRRVLEWK